MSLTMACMKCNRMIKVGASCPTCITPEDEEFNRIERESKIKQEYVRAMQRPYVQHMSVAMDDYLKIMEELAWARVVIRELGDRLAELEGKK